MQYVLAGQSISWKTTISVPKNNEAVYVKAQAENGKIYPAGPLNIELVP